MIVVDSFTGAIFLFAIKGKTAAITAVIGQQVIAFIGSPVDWVTDNGGEWQAEFEEMLQRNNVNKRLTSSYHPQANGKAERSVQVVKQLLQRRLAEPNSDNSTVYDFESLLPHIMMAYNCSRHSATGYSPYFLMYGRDVVVPAQARAIMRQPLDLEDPATLQRLLFRRAEILRYSVPKAAGNRRQAQGTDIKAYLSRHTNNLRPSARANLQVGDPVYLHRRANHGLELAVQPHILQVVQIKTSGILRLQGADGRCITDHRQNVSPCGLVELDFAIDPGTARVAADASCEICEEHDPVGRSLTACSMCSTVWHWRCLRRQNMVSAHAPPRDPLVWYCPYCVQLRILPVDVDLDGAEVRRRTPNVNQVGPLQLLIPTCRVSSAELSQHWKPQPVSPASTWTLVDRHAVHALLQRHMPGHWQQRRLTILAKAAPSPRDGYPSQPTAVSHAPTELGAYDSLRLALRWDRIKTILDPWAGHGSTPQSLSDLTSVLATDLVQRGAPLHALANALEVGDLRRLASLFGPYDGIVASPWFSVLDLALSAALSAQRRFVAFHVPGTYLTSALPARAALLQRLSEEGRLLLITNLPRSANGWRCAWLIVFSSAHEREFLVAEDAQLRCHSWVLFSSACEGVTPAGIDSPVP